ncbi:MAG TPA: SDR family NAD(P)-dependent oxidoreductase [Abditibacteriaceae bacterium]|jgi:acyl transferase domain-containing protein/NAD(P)H-dependent flavin oxidoreductase YrpB (nitropropane dioxygenase family)
MKQEFEIGVLSPIGSTRLDVLLAAGRAGALAIVDAARLSGAMSLSALLQEQLCTLRNAMGQRFGLRIEVSQVVAIVPLLEALRGNAENDAGTPVLDLIVLAGQCDSAALAAARDALRPLARRIFRETVSVEEAQQASDAGVDGLVAKGNESGGRVGTESTFVLLQRLQQQNMLPLWAQGGIGPHTAAACRVAGAQGILLDNQLALAEEADLPSALRSQIAAMDGTETICLGESLGVPFRVHRLRGKEHIKKLQNLEASGASAVEFQTALFRVLATTNSEPLCPLGQDAALASRLAARYRTVDGILRAYRQHVTDNVTLAAEKLSLRPHSEFAQSHGLRFPIFQGPMTRVSDVAPFADAVARGGGLPFLALALLREAAVERLLQETSELLGERPWGVGILGFVPAELRNEQMRAVLKTKPRYALLAGGRPDQAQALEAQGIATYIHAPSPRLLEMFLRQGSRRFIFEGRECGGHVGPLSSFMLWESALDVLLDFQEETGKENKNAEPIHVLFAGGIHDDLSAAMVSALAAKATAAGIRIGVLMGTAYLFTSEAVQSGAIIPTFQEEALACRDTVLLDTEGGHAIRCAPTSYAAEFTATKRRLLQDGATPEEARRELEALNLGRLRIASKGVSRGESALQADLSQSDLSQTLEASTRGDTYADIVTDAAPNSALTEVPVERQKREGMYMIGEVAALRDKVITIEELHGCVSHGSTEKLQAFAAQQKSAATATLQLKELHQPIAIIGMGCLYPGASDPHELWTNILQKHDAITEVPRDRWNADIFYNPDPKVPDRVVSKWGGFIDPIHFDPLSYGIIPNTLASVEPMQLLMLEVVRQALQDSGYDRRPFTRERTGVIIGAGGGMADLGLAYGARCMIEQYLHEIPDLDEATRQRVLDGLHQILPEMTEDSFPGILVNVAAGRVASRFDLGGPNYTLDAACASSLAAVEAGVKELRHGTSDLVVVGGVDTQQSPFSFLVFSKTHALSPTGRCRPFDAKSDGIAIGEGVAAILLKRLDDAVRDGDKVYAVLRGIAGGSDGRDKSLTAPSINGQRRAMQRAYEGLEFTPSSVGLAEAHGTGTVVGDRTELESMRRVFVEAGAAPQNCALGSVKSMIGHTKNAAGIAGLIKATLALHHRTLPPTLANEPTEAARDRSTPFYLNTQARPWFGNAASPGNSVPRRAAVSAFGFGGTNFHAVLEEFPGNAPANTHRPAELFLFRAASRPDLAKQLQTLHEALGKSVENKKAPHLVDVAAMLQRELGKARGDCRLAIVAGTVEELRTRLATAVQTLHSDGDGLESGPIALGEQPVDGKIAFLFPGQGSQHLNMLGEMALYLPVVREAFEEADRVLDGVLPKPLSSTIFPPPAYSIAEEKEQRAHLDQTWLAQPALGAANYAMLVMLRELGIEPDMLGGHSYGEYVALHAAGVLNFADMMRLSEQRGRIVQETQGCGTVGLVAVRASAEELAPILGSDSGVSIASQNAPEQAVIGGTVAAIEAILPRLDEAMLSYQRLAVSAGFHIPEARPAAERLTPILQDIEFTPGHIPVYSNRTAQPYPADADATRRLLVEHLTETVLFKDQIEHMYQAGARLFVEVGPKAVLSSLTRSTLSGRTATILATNRNAAANGAAANGVTDFLETIGRLFVSGVALRTEKLFAGCNIVPLTVEAIAQPAKEPSPTTWVVDGGKAKPLREIAHRATTSSVVAPAAIPTPNATPHTSTHHSLAASSTKQIHNLAEHKTMTMPSTAMPPSVSSSAAASAPIAPTATTPTVATPTMAMPGTALPAVVTATQVPLVVPGQLAPLAQAVDANSAAGVMAQFQASMQSFLEHQSQAQAQRQQLMAQFLATQQTVVQAYFAGTSGQPMPQNTTVPPQVVPAQPRAVVVAAPVAQPAPVMPPAAMPSIMQPVAAPPISVAPISTHAPEFETTAVATSNGTNGYHADAGSNATASITLAHATPEPEVPAHVEPVATAGTITDDTDLEALVLDMVSEFTGYPVEMLELDQNMEADLGIDSIKRTEIFSSLRDRLGMSGGEFNQEEYFMKIARLRTLREVIEWLEEEVAEATDSIDSSSMPEAPELTLATASTQALPEAASATVAMPKNHNTTSASALEGASVQPRNVRRFVVRSSSAPLGEGQRELSEHDVILVTEDNSARARELLTALHSAGVNGALVRHGASARSVGAGVYEANLLSGESVQELKVLIGEQHGKVTALCHLLALDPPQDADEDCIEVKSLFLLTQAFGEELRAARGGILAVTGLGGTFGLETQPAIFRPGQAAIAGFLKSLAREWPEVAIKALDVDPAQSEEFLLPQLLAEITTTDATVEVGYTSAGRSILQAVAAELDNNDATQALDAGSVLLVTGGARGITAAVCEELAARYQPTLVLVGRSPLPGAEDAATAALTTPADIKRVLAARHKERAETATPTAIEAEYQTIIHAREIRSNLERLRSLGARYEYHSLDVRNSEAFEALIAAVYQKHGRIDGVIHGAGVIEDSLVTRKTPESFNRVFDTKVVAAKTLARALRPESLRLVVFFSSIAARLGNAGQTDYAAANEALNKLAAELDRKWPARVVSIGWGPWEGTGMASPLLREHLAKSGLDYLPMQAGREMFLREIEQGRKGEVEVLVLAVAGDGGLLAAQQPSGTDLISRDIVLPDALGAQPSVPLTAERERV